MLTSLFVTLKTCMIVAALWTPNMLPEVKHWLCLLCFAALRKEWHSVVSALDKAASTCELRRACNIRFSMMNAAGSACWAVPARDSYQPPQGTAVCLLRYKLVRWLKHDPSSLANVTP